MFDTRAGNAAVIYFLSPLLFLRADPITIDSGGKAWLYSLQLLPDSGWLPVAVPRPKSHLDPYRSGRKKTWHRPGACFRPGNCPGT